MRILFPLLLLLSPSCSLADPSDDAKAKEKASYTSEAPLPKDWPAPGPYNIVSEKSYPSYRLALTHGSSPFAFWTLFNHIKKKNIPMTAPVEMGMEQVESTLEKNNMAFLYQNTTVGKTGPDGKKIKIKDIPPLKTLSYAWMGPDSKTQIKKAQNALNAKLAEKGLKATSFRLLGYNSPSISRKKRSYELQAILPKP